MKQLTLIIGIVFLLLSAPNIQAQKFSGLDKSPMDVASYPSIHDDQNTQIKIIYSKAPVKRKIFK
jgi:hypothetical protein